MLIPKIGGVAAHPANVHRLLYDERQLVLVFPEGRKGTEKLYKDRYRLRRFGRGGFVEAAMRAEAKLVPVCVVGAEEAAPIFAQVPAMQRLTGPDLLPAHPDLPLARAARDARLPAGEVQAPLPRADRHRRARRRRTRSTTRRWCRRSRRRSAPGSRRTCTRCSRSERASGSAERAGRVERRRAAGCWSPASRPTGAGAWRRRSRASSRSRRSSASTRASRRSSSSAPSSSRSPTSTRCCSGSSARPRSTR